MAKVKKADKVILKETFVKGTYVPDKKELCDLIMKDEVSIYISERGKKESGMEFMSVVVNHK